MATAVWVWDLQKMSLEAVLEQTSAVRCFQWDPKRPRLALCTGNGKLYLWSPAGCASVQVPTEGSVLLPSCDIWSRELTCIGGQVLFSARGEQKLLAQDHVFTISCFLLLGGFLVQALKWHCSGDSLMLIGKEQLCLCYMEAEQQDQ